MEARDFIYHFTNILFSEIVRSTILIENWEEADFDYRYAEYADIFLKMRDGCLNYGKTDDDILKMLRNSRKPIINSYNDTMSKNFYNEIERNKVDPAVYEQMILTDILKDDEINIQCLEQFRRFEERTFTKKPRTEV